MFSAKYVGHACIMLNFDGVKILTDPWFGYPFYANNMIGYPPVVPLSEKEISEISAIQISHLHQDHFCEKTLDLLPKNIDVLIGKYPDPLFLNKIEKKGFKNIIAIAEEVVDYRTIKIGIFLPEFFDFSFDSLSVFQFQGKSYFLNNDCLLKPPKYQKIKQLFGEFEVGFLGYTMVNPYPSCYQLAIKTQQEEFAATRLKCFKNVEYLDEVFEFKKIIPYANGLRFFENETLYHNATFSDPVDLKTAFSKKEKICVLEPGDHFPLATEKSNPVFNYELTPMNQFISRQGFKLKHSFSHFGFLAPKDYETFLDAYLKEVSQKWKSDMAVQINIIHGDSYITLFYIFKDGKLGRTKTLSIQPHLAISFKAEWLNEAIHKKISMLALYFNFNFHVQIFDPQLKDQYWVHGW